MVLVPKQPDQKPVVPAPSAPASQQPSQPPKPAAPTSGMRGTFDSATAQLKRWQETASYSVIAFVAALGLAALSLVWYTGSDIAEYRAAARRKLAAPAVPAAPTEPAARRALDGAPVEPGTPEPDYFAVMIDNIIEAHPYVGVAQASLVIEAPVEGGITRLFAVYPSDATVEKIGPVRSARPYYLGWAKEYGALYVHVGGSPEALELIRAGGVRDLNEFFAGASFWRDPERYAPHSTFTSIELLAAAAAKRGKPRALLSWKFKLDAPEEERGDGTLVVEMPDFGQAGVAWVYDRGTNDFARVVDGEVETDGDGTPVRAKNVVVQYVPVRILDDIGRRRIDIESGGEALVALDGRVIGGRWEKDPDGGRTRFRDAAGNEIKFNAGLTWIEAVPTGMTVTY